MIDYDARVAAELRTFAEQEVVHDLPPIHHFWTSRVLTPLMAEVGVPDVNSLWRREIAEQCRLRAPERVPLVSLGAGNGELELALAEALRREGVEKLELVLLELNADMLVRADAQARRIGIEDRVRSEVADLNVWKAREPVDIYPRQPQPAPRRRARAPLRAGPRLADRRWSVPRQRHDRSERAPALARGGRGREADLAHPS